MKNYTKRSMASGGGSGGSGSGSGSGGGGGGVIRGQTSTTTVTVATGRGHFSSGGSGARKRMWWGLDGPVDSCCFFFSLRAGVGLLAANDLLNGMVAVLYLHTFYASHLRTVLTTMRSRYMSFCAGIASSTPECEHLREAMEQTEGHLEVYHNLPSSVYLQGFFCMVAGAVGLWGIFHRSKRVVRWYMLSWPAKIVLGVLTAVNMRSLHMKYDVVRGPTTAIVWFLNVLLNIYFFKVSWSYYKLRLPDEEDSPIQITSSSLNTAREEHPMLAMSIVV